MEEEEKEGRRRKGEAVSQLESLTRCKKEVDEIRLAKPDS